MLWEERGIGSIVVVRQPAEPVLRGRDALLRPSPTRRSIAIQNARLFNETKEALEHQTATAEVLKVISDSPTDVQPVFDAIAERARTLCDAHTGGVAQFDGTLVHLRAFTGASRDAEQQMLALYPMKPGRGAASTRAILERAPVQIADVLEDPEYTLKALRRPRLPKHPRGADAARGSGRSARSSCPAWSRERFPKSSSHCCRPLPIRP